MGTGKATSGARVAAALFTVLFGLMLVGVPTAGAKVGPRVTIAVYGDSVVEGYSIPDVLRDALIPRLGDDLAGVGGFEVAATGLIPVTAFRWHFNRYTVDGLDAPRPDAWDLFGVGAATFGVDGPSGYSAVAVSPRATATTAIDAPLVAVLFTKFAGSGVFTVTAGGKTFAIDARSSGPPTPSEQWITVPPGAHTITVHGPSSGSVIFDGVIVRAPVTPGRIGVELENLAHGGHVLTQDSGPRIVASLRQQRFDISVFLSATLWAFRAASGDRRYETLYANELRARVGLVRAYGGLCLIADSSPLPLPAVVLARFAAIDRQVARERGCAYTGALAHLWSAATAFRTGTTLIDDIHPRALGYRLMAEALAPRLVSLVRQRVRTRTRTPRPGGPR
jgi:lysophospholipase L1-like esterase